MSFDFVSLVGRGDDPLAQVVLSKAEPTGIEKDEDMGDKKTEIEKDGLAADVLEYIEVLEKENVDLSTDLVKAQDDLTEAEEKLSKADISKSDDFEELVKSAEKSDPALAKVLRQQHERIEKAEKDQKAERDVRLDAEYLSKAEKLPMLEGKREDLAGLLRRVGEAVKPEDAAAIEKILKTANDNLATSGLFEEFGKSGEETTISKSVDAAAEAIRKADPKLTKEQAIAKAYEENPDLFAQAMTEKD